MSPTMKWEVDNGSPSRGYWQVRTLAKSFFVPIAGLRSPWSSQGSIGRLLECRGFSQVQESSARFYR